jgi:hypothetical protein
MASYTTHYPNKNYQRQFNTDEFYNKIIKRVVNLLNRPLIESEKDETIKFIKNLDPVLLTHQYQSKTINIVVDTLVDEFKQFKCDKPEYDDTQEILRGSIGITSETSTAYSIYDNPNYLLNIQPKPPKTIEQFESKSNVSKEPSLISNLLGLTSCNDAARLFNPESFIRKNYIILDSRYRELNGSNTIGITSFTWSYVLQSLASQQGTVNIVGNVRDIIALRIYPCRIPYVSSADNKYSRISILINQLSSQSFIAHENRNFHFMLRSVIDDTFINLHTNDYNDGYFYFEKPITTIDKLTLTFGSPIEPVVFDKDRDLCTIDYFIIQPLTKITTGNLNSPTPHNLTNGDRVYFTDFKTGVIDPSLVNEIAIDNAIVELINNINGFVVTVIDAVSFSIILDTSNIQSPINNLVFNVFYGSKRMFIPIEITYIMPEYNLT